ncbi:DUF6192 family protein [Streptomyces sp. URMC 126]|uniref:DUF6192 family protein n=1 Tax=Streptomyces sp. URMC 126 TaxID=3423401 RepID=UPI003F1D0423
MTALRTVLPAPPSPHLAPRRAVHRRRPPDHTRDPPAPAHRAHRLAGVGEEAVRGLVRDDAVAKVASDVLRWPEVAAWGAADDTARRMVNRAEADRSRRQAAAFRQISPAGPAVRRIERTEEFVDLLGAFHR